MFDTLPPDIVIQRQVEEAIAAGHPVPRWGWKMPLTYGGCTGAERIAGWQKVRIAEQHEWVRREGFCSVCHVANAEHFHAENYLRPIAVKRVCRSCHFHIHRRFGDPERWRRFLAVRARPGDWALSLWTVEPDRLQAKRIAAAPDIFAALAAR